MELSEMIKVMQHYADGGGVECSSKGRGIWNTLSNSDHYWNWQIMDYRIKEQKQKVTIEKWLMQNTKDKEYRIIETSLVDKIVHFKKVKLMESYEVEL